MHKASGVARKTFQVAGFAKIPASLTHTHSTLTAFLRRSTACAKLPEAHPVHRAGDIATRLPFRLCQVVQRPCVRDILEASHPGVPRSIDIDSQRQSQIAHICERPFCCQDEQASRHMMVKVLCRGMLPRSMPIFSKRNWCGIDKSLDSVGLCVAVHGLLFKALAAIRIIMCPQRLERSQKMMQFHPQVLHASFQAELEDYRRKVRRWRQGSSQIQAQSSTYCLLAL